MALPSPRTACHLSDPLESVWITGEGWAWIDGEWTDWGVWQAAGWGGVSLVMGNAHAINNQVARWGVPVWGVRRRGARGEPRGGCEDSREAWRGRGNMDVIVVQVKERNYIHTYRAREGQRRL